MKFWKIAGIVVGLLALLTVFMTLWAVLLPGCAQSPAPTPPPPTTTTTTVAPEPTPTPEPPIEACFPVGGTWEPSAAQDPEEMLWAVREAQEYLGDRCGHADATEGPQRESLRLLALELESRGFCAGYMPPDAVFVEREDGRFEEHHAVYFGDGCWLSNSFKGIWEAK